MPDGNAQKVLGLGYYQAHWIEKTSLVRLTASGILPCSNYHAQLEKRPERIIPPMWDMIFLIEKVCLKALKPFVVEAIMGNSSGAKTVQIRDAVGDHEIPILPSISKTKITKNFISAADADQYTVYAKLPKIDEHHRGCIVVPADTFVTAIHYKIFGPAPKADCEQFVNKSCGSGLPDQPIIEALGDEIPWPFVFDN